MLAPVAPTLDPVGLGSVSDNVLDGYRAVAPHLVEQPGADVLIVYHGLKSVPLYAAQAALALGAGRVDYASDDVEALALDERLGAIDDDWVPALRLLEARRTACATPSAPPYRKASSRSPALPASTSGRVGIAILTIRPSLIAGSPYAAGASSQSTTRVVTSAGRKRPASISGITSGWSAAEWARPVKKRTPSV
jgi:hypothetical protein